MDRRRIKNDATVKLTSARKEIEDALRLAVPAARYDPILLIPGARTRLANLWDDLGRFVEGPQEKQ